MSEAQESAELVAELIVALQRAHATVLTVHQEYQVRLLAAVEEGGGWLG
ncbi:hypothetical protein [Kitasatospora sp. MMS16-BH015]|nr:hypothetical protein [Kitasatospora sp. MMS16-BH015]